MVPAPAPRAHREAVSSAPNDWTRSYRLVGAGRTLRRSLYVSSLAVCALTAAGSWNRTEAEATAETPVSAQADTSPGSRSAFLMGTQGAQLSSATPKLKTAIARSNRGFEATVPAPVKRFAYGVPQAVAPLAASGTRAPHSAASAVQTPALPSGPLEQVSLQVRADGKVRALKVAVPQGATLAQALTAAGFAYNFTDRVTPALTAPAHNGMTVSVVRIQSALRTRYETVTSQTRYKPTPTIRRGTTQTQSGHAGVIAVTERVWKRDGQVTSVQFVERKVVRPVQHTIIAMGTKPSYMPNNVPYHRRYAQAYSLPSRGGGPRDRAAATAQNPTPWNYGGDVAPANPGTFQAVKSLTVVATGYAAGRAGGAIGSRTATGLPCGYGAVAVDPRVIPLGSKLYIEGYGYGIACDTGGAIKGNRIDLAFDSVGAAFQLGRRTVKVWVLQ